MTLTFDSKVIYYFMNCFVIYIPKAIIVPNVYILGQKMKEEFALWAVDKFYVHICVRSTVGSKFKFRIWNLCFIPLTISNHLQYMNSQHQTTKPDFVLRVVDVIFINVTLNFDYKVIALICNFYCKLLVHTIHCVDYEHSPPKNKISVSFNH